MSAPGVENATAFPVLAAAELADVAEFGSERPMAAGELLFAAGEASYDLFVVLEGAVEVGRFDGGTEVVIASYGPGGFPASCTS